MENLGTRGMVRLSSDTRCRRKTSNLAIRGRRYELRTNERSPMLFAFRYLPMLLIWAAGCTNEDPPSWREMFGTPPVLDSENILETDTGVSFGEEWRVDVPWIAEAPKLVPTTSFIYLPSDAEVKMLMVFEANSDGRTEFASAAWRLSALGRQYALAMVEMKDNSGYPVASIFPEQAASRLLRVVSAFATATNHPELSSCKLILWGHSAGSHLMTPVASILSDRTAAYVAYKGGAITTNSGRLLHEGYLTDRKFLRLPGLILVASNEPDGLKDAAYTLFNTGRGLGARMMLAIEKNGQHIGVGTTEAIMVPFVEAIVSSNSFSEVPPDGRLGSPSRVVEEWSGQLTFHRVKGDGSGFSTDVVDSAKIAPQSGPPFNGCGLLSWIPNAALAEIWQGYETGLIF